MANLCNLGNNAMIRESHSSIGWSMKFLLVCTSVSVLECKIFSCYCVLAFFQFFLDWPGYLHLWIPLQQGWCGRLLLISLTLFRWLVCFAYTAKNFSNWYSVCLYAGVFVTLSGFMVYFYSGTRMFGLEKYQLLTRTKITTEQYAWIRALTPETFNHVWQKTFYPG